MRIGFILLWTAVLILSSIFLSTLIAYITLDNSDGGYKWNVIWNVLAGILLSLIIYAFFVSRIETKPYLHAIIISILSEAFGVISTSLILGEFWYPTWVIDIPFTLALPVAGTFIGLQIRRLRRQTPRPAEN
ncbi:hypothetical protein BTA51_20025 [Hahella sp. CCB-MM4]|nr:hypothetical protein BTA51_20025 [Hahella sp. CCB-MM4]